MNSVIQYILGYVQLLRITDFIDILIVSIIIYSMIKLLRETRAVQLVKGLALLLIVFLVSDWLHLNTLHFLLSSTVQIGMFALVVIFQPELRTLLERIGRIDFVNMLDLNADHDNSDTISVIESVVATACDLSETKTGALIVMERTTKLTDYIQTGTKIDATVSSRLLENIFVPNTPLHDGAVIISGNRIVAASCLLPLTNNKHLSQDLGTRHRAAIGLSECTDAIVVVVSEESGKISIALNGTLTRNLSEATLTNALTKTLIPPKPDTEPEAKSKFRRSK